MISNVFVQIFVKNPPMLLILFGGVFHLMADPFGGTLIAWGIVLQIVWLFRPLIFAAIKG